MEQDCAIQHLPADHGSSLLVVDFMMLLHMVCTETSDCVTFGQLSQHLFEHVLASKHDFISVVSDSYCNKHSIKSGERCRRGAVQMEEIHNPPGNTPIPKQ